MEQAPITAAPLVSFSRSACGCSLVVRNNSCCLCVQNVKANTNTASLQVITTTKLGPPSRAVRESFKSYTLRLRVLLLLRIAILKRFDLVCVQGDVSSGNKVKQGVQKALHKVADQFCAGGAPAVAANQCETSQHANFSYL